MLEVAEFIASIFKRRLKLTGEERSMILRSRMIGNKLSIEYGDKEDVVIPYDLKIITKSNNEHDVLELTDVKYHTLSVGYDKYKGCGDAEMHQVVIVWADGLRKEMYFKKESLIAIV